MTMRAARKPKVLAVVSACWSDQLEAGPTLVRPMELMAAWWIVEFHGGRESLTVHRQWSWRPGLVDNSDSWLYLQTEA